MTNRFILVTLAFVAAQTSFAGNKVRVIEECSNDDITLKITQVSGKSDYGAVVTIAGLKGTSSAGSTLGKPSEYQNDEFDLRIQQGAMNAAGTAAKLLLGTDDGSLRCHFVTSN